MAQNNLAVTRVSLVIVGLMLVVLAVTVLLLAARLLADRRAPEQTLMSSRGASGRQLLALAALEAAVVALVTTLVSPWLAGLLFQAITAVGPLAKAGLHHDPGRPPSLWITCAVSSFVLAAVLLGPLLRRRGSVVDAEQQLVRQDRRGGLARSGADLALLVLAGLAVWQLRSYQSPVAESGAERLDPVLVLAPALLLLAGAVLALRLMPLVARAGERMAARSRSLVSPLAAWEVGRRPGRAAGAVLLLTLALAVGTFSQSFLSTWRTSQGDQVDLAVGTDVRLDRMDGSGIAQASTVDALTGVQAASPVTFRSVPVGQPSDTPGESSGRHGQPPRAGHHPGGRAAARPDLAVLEHHRRTPATRRARSRHRAPRLTQQPPGRHRGPAGRRARRIPAGQPRRRGPARHAHPGGAASRPPARTGGRRRRRRCRPPRPGLQLVGVVAQVVPAADADRRVVRRRGADIQLDVRGVEPARRRTTRRSHGTDTVTPVDLTSVPWTVQGALQSDGNRPLLAGQDRGRGPARRGRRSTRARSCSASPGSPRRRSRCPTPSRSS